MKPSFACLLLLVLTLGVGRAATVNATCKSAAGAEFAAPGSSDFSPLQPGQVPADRQHSAHE